VPKLKKVFMAGYIRDSGGFVLFESLVISKDVNSFCSPGRAGGRKLIG